MLPITAHFSFERNAEFRHRKVFSFYCSYLSTKEKATLSPKKPDEANNSMATQTFTQASKRIRFVEFHGRNIFKIRFIGYKLASQLQDSDTDRSVDDLNMPVSMTIAESSNIDVDNS